MRTFPVVNEGGQTVAFEVGNVLISPGQLHAILSRVSGVTNVRRREPFSGEANWLVRFEFSGRPYVVVEPFGDSSRYWVGPENSGDLGGDVEPLRAAVHAYGPPIWRRLLAAVFSPRTAFSS